MNPRLRWVLVGLALVLLLALSLSVGPGGFPWPGSALFFEVRLPRAIAAIFAGGVLAFVGAVLQGLFQNPLVDPYILGIASGAAFGSSIALSLGWATGFTLPFFSFLGAVGATLLVYNLARLRGVLSRPALILAGVVLSFLFSSLVLVVMVFGRKPLAQIVYLMLGRLGIVFTPSLVHLFVLTILLALLGTVFLYGYARQLDILSTTEDAARSLGVDTGQLTRAVFFASSLLVALVVSFTGTISFVGLVVPHTVRLVFGPRHSTLLPASFLVGAGFLLLADVLARSLAPVELPLSVVTALFGVPFFVYLLRTRL